MTQKLLFEQCLETLYNTYPEGATSYGTPATLQSKRDPFLGKCNMSKLEGTDTMNTKEVNVMLDLETLGKKPGCKILTISACTFMELESRRRFHQAVRIDTQDLLRIDPDTIDWWSKQSDVARKAAFDNPNAIVLTRALGLFSDWLAELGATPVIWGKGASFDAPVLTAAYAAYGIDIPWDFRKERCFRTLQELFKYLECKPPFVGTPHTSQADAEFQANHAENILSHLGFSRTEL
jgi:hypothetical protein